jgi:ankyrin repeat protein
MQEWTPEWQQALYQSDCAAIAEILAKDPGAANRRNTRGETPITYAVDNDCAEVIPLLAAAGADLNARIEGGPIDAHGRKTHDGATALTDAAGYPTTGTLRLGALLLEHGANPNLANTEGYTPLHLAAERSALDQPNQLSDVLDFLTLLLKSGADPNLPDPHGRTALDMVYLTRSGEAVRLLLAHGACLQQMAGTDGAELVLAALASDPDAVDTQLQKCDINSRDISGYTALHAVARSGDAAMVAHLLARGADPNIRADVEHLSRLEDEPTILPSAGVMPLHEAASACHAEIIHLLLAAGAEKDAPAKLPSGDSPLMCVMESAALAFRYEEAAQECFNVLLNAGADLHIRAYTLKNNLPWTALSIAALHSSDFLDLLLEHGAARTAEDVLAAMHAATLDNGLGGSYSLPILWDFGRELDPPLLLVDTLPYLNWQALNNWVHADEEEEFPETVAAFADTVNEPHPQTGETPLLWMLRHACTEISPEGSTLYRYNAEDVALLLRHGADITARDQAGQGFREAVLSGEAERQRLGLPSLLTHAVQEIRPAPHELVRLLLDAGIDADIDNGFPLLVAAVEGDLDVLRLLPKAGADPSQRYHSDMIVSARHNATENWQGIPLYPDDLDPEKEYRALDLAEMRGFSEAAGLLLQSLSRSSASAFPLVPVKPRPRRRNI